VIAGGTDLLIDLQQGRHAPFRTLVDISAIPELQEIRLLPDGILVGAAAPLREIVEHRGLIAEAPALVEACLLIGGPQVRNVATLGGNVAHALPAGDGTIALLALGAEANLAAAEGRRWVRLADLFAGPGVPAFDPGREIIVSFRLPRLGPRETSAFERVMRPQGVAIAILNLAVWLRLSIDDVMEDLRLAIGPAGPQPFRAVHTEAILRGRRLDESRLQEAAQALRSESSFRTSPHRATAEYRDHLAEVLLRRTLRAAQERLGVRETIAP
jgi:CO/xanthine dehydrogenase FAD-binding subunit